MSAEEGARAQHKRRTHERIVEVATDLFLSHGFTAVSVADIAAAAHVSKMTVFNYFDTKEDLLLSQLGDRVDEAAGVVRSRPAEIGPLDALRLHFIEHIRLQDPSTGVCLDEHAIAVRALIVENRGLLTRLIEQSVQAEESLAMALAEIPGSDDLSARTAATQVIGIHRILSARNFERSRAGADAQQLIEVAVSEAERAFALIRAGLADTAFG